MPYHYTLQLKRGIADETVVAIRSYLNRFAVASSRLEYKRGSWVLHFAHAYDQSLIVNRFPDAVSISNAGADEPDTGSRE